MKYIFSAVVLLSCIAAGSSFSQDRHIQGTVRGLEFHEGQADTLPLYGAELFWLNSSVGTTTDRNGAFFLQKPADTDPLLVVRYVAYEPDTLLISPGTQTLDIFLVSPRTSETVSIAAEKPHTMDHADHPVNTRTLTETGLRTLACCTLAESFENTAAVDAEETDAVSGARRIRMLGLASHYTQVLIEKNPAMRGLVSSFGLDYIPGPCMEAIDISKGAASVVTGYESTTGQINVELRKPEKGDPFHLNLFRNSMGRTEGSMVASGRLNPAWGTMLLLYGAGSGMKLDGNGDTFLDMPLFSHLNMMNRWSYRTETGHIQFGLSFLRDHRDGGQTLFDFEKHVATDQAYGFHNKTGRAEVFLKAGTSLSGSSSIGLILSAFGHDQRGFWGIKHYEGREKGLYANLVFQKAFDRNSLSAGMSYQADQIDEIYSFHPYDFRESVPGWFAEYTFKRGEWLTAMTGIRYDRHNLYGDFWTPRFHLMFKPSLPTTVRLSAGKGYRSPHLFSENLIILASSRELVIEEKPTAEEAWNAGVQWTTDFSLGRDRPASLIIDFYRTSFLNQMIIDTERESGGIFVYNLNGKSYSNSIQAEINAVLFRHFQTTAAFRYNDVKATINNELVEQPLVGRYKGLLVLSWSPGKYQFDLTAQLNGPSRLPRTDNNPDPYKKALYSPAYPLLFGQVTYKLAGWQFYAGIENITGYKQADPILAWQEPFSRWFDSSLIWGPTIGRRIYAGIRVN